MDREFIPDLHYIVYGVEAVLAKKDLSVTFDLMINSSHILISVVINDSLTREPIFLHNRDLKWLIKEFVTELVRWQEIIFNEVLKMYPMVDQNSLPSRVRSTWTNWASQVPILRFNSGKYDLNMVKYCFIKTISDLSDVKVAKKDNLYMFVTKFKFLDARNYLALDLSYDSWCKANGCLDARNYLARGLSYDGWCKANRCLMEKLVFPYEWQTITTSYHTSGQYHTRLFTLSLKVTLRAMNMTKSCKPSMSEDAK